MKTQTSCETPPVSSPSHNARDFKSPAFLTWIGWCFTKTTMVTLIAYYVWWVWRYHQYHHQFDSQALLCCCPGGSSSCSIFSTQDMHRDLAGHFYEILRTLGHWRSYTQQFTPQNLSHLGFVTDIICQISIFHPHVGGPIVAVKVSSLKETQSLP